MEDTTFLGFIRLICKRPSMYTGGTIKETLAFIDGYRFGNATPISGRVFDRYVCIRNSFPDNYGWSYVIEMCSKDSNEAFQIIEETIAEFLKLKEQMSDDELIQYVSEQLIEESEPEKIFRQFDKALLTGNQLIIRQLIEPHKDAEILWEGSYPEEVALQLIEISSLQPIKSIPISENGKKVKIIAQGWPFPIEMNFTNEKWLINVEKIIELRMNNK